MSQEYTVWNGQLASNNPAAGTTEGGNQEFLEEPNGYIMPSTPPLSVSTSGICWAVFWQLPNSTNVFGATFSRIDNVLFFIQQLVTQKGIGSISMVWQSVSVLSSLSNVAWQHTEVNVNLPEQGGSPT